MSNPQTNQSDAPPEIERLFEQGQNLTDAARTAIVELGEEATEPLVDILANREMWDEEAPGGGWAPIYAADILGELGDPRAIDPMYDVLADCEPDAILDTKLTVGLRRFGEAAIKPGLRALERHGPDFRDDLAGVFSGLGVRKRVVFQVLVKTLVRSPIIGAANLAEYGDPEALDALFPMFNRLLRAAAEDRTKAEMAVAVAEAIEQLGGELDDNQTDQLEIIRDKKGGAREILRRVKEGIGDHHHPDTFVNKRDIGRNDPCWCGSERKYKHCHWKEDRQ